MSKIHPLTLIIPLLAFGTGLGPGVAAAVAQRVPTVSIGAATASFADPFSEIGGVREVASGKVVVVDPRDRVVELVDLASGASTRIGRTGSGPGEYQFPYAVFPLPNDESVVSDPGQRRFIRLDGTGKVVETVPFPSGFRLGMRPLGTDLRGRIYWEGASIDGPGRPDTDDPTKPRDSVPVIRWDRSTDRMDTLALVKGQELRIHVSGGPNSRNMAVRPVPFSARDGWAVAPDGRLAIARSGTYRVDGRSVAGARNGGSAVVGVPVFPVTDRDKQDFLRGMRSQPRMIRSEGTGGGGTMLPAGPGPSADEFDWPVNKPFFDATSIRMSPSGELWVMRYRRAGDEIPVYDVLGPDGRLVRRVTFPSQARLVGFGDGTVYVARTNEDDLQFLERYRIP